MIDRRRKLIFIHIPKTGGSSIESLLLGSDEVGNHHTLDRDILTRREFADYFPLMRHATLSEYERQLQQTGEEPTNYRVFTLVRDPRQMLRSAYRFRLSNYAIRRNVMSIWKRIRFRLEHVTFSVFLAVQMLRSLLACGNFQSLGKYISSDTLKDVKVFRLEDLSENPERLFDFLGFAVVQNLPHKNPTETRSNLKSLLLETASRMIFPDIYRLYK